MNKTFLSLIILLSITSCTFPQTKYLGYQEDCLNMQSEKIDSIFKETVGIERYMELYEINQTKIKYKILVVIDINHKGEVKNVFISDKNKFLLKNEESAFINNIYSTSFNLCLCEIEHRDLSKEDVFKNSEIIQYGIFLPLFSALLKNGP